MEVRFNANDYVKVRLTSFGESIKAESGRKFPLIDAEGYYSFQFHDLMGMFGPATLRSSLAPFEQNEIVFIVDDL